MKTILAPIDFSPVSRKVIAAAVDLARALEARVVLLHAVAPAPIILTDLDPLAGPAFSLTDDVEKSTARHLRRLQRDLASRGALVETICVSGVPVTQVLDQARKLEADYIVVGSHGHTAFHDLIVGGTASGVLKGALCPVVVVPKIKKGSGRRKK